jgi:hypothetical protein
MLGCLKELADLWDGAVRLRQQPDLLELLTDSHRGNGRSPVGHSARERARLEQLGARLTEQGLRKGKECEGPTPGAVILPQFDHALGCAAGTHEVTDNTKAASYLAREGRFIERSYPRGSVALPATKRVLSMAEKPRSFLPAPKCGMATCLHRVEPRHE